MTRSEPTGRFPGVGVHTQNASIATMPLAAAAEGLRRNPTVLALITFFRSLARETGLKLVLTGRQGTIDLAELWPEQFVAEINRRAGERGLFPRLSAERASADQVYLPEIYFEPMLELAAACSPLMSDLDNNLRGLTIDYVDLCALHANYYAASKTEIGGVEFPEVVGGFLHFRRIVHYTAVSDARGGFIVMYTVERGEEAGKYSLLALEPGTGQTRMGFYNSLKPDRKMTLGRLAYAAAYLSLVLQGKMKMEHDLTLKELYDFAGEHELEILEQL